MNKIFFILAYIFATALLSTSCSANNKHFNRLNFANSSEIIRVGTVVRDCEECPDMVAVPQIGHAEAAPGRIFYAGRFEITWKKYLSAVREKYCPIPEKSFGGKYDLRHDKIDDDYPITGLNPDIFSCYLSWLKYKSGHNYRIPSAQEWEHIARAGTLTSYYWGDDLGYGNAIVFDHFSLNELRRQLGYPAGMPGNTRHDPRVDVESEKIFPVGRFKPNPWGLFDVIGNAAEVTTERAASAPDCLSRQPPKLCEAINVRGNDIYRLPHPTKSNAPITQSLTVARYRAAAHGGTHRTGFRVVRD